MQDSKFDAPVIFVVLELHSAIIQSPSKVTIGLDPSPTVIQLICCACISIVSNTGKYVGLRLSSGAAIPTVHIGSGSPVSELNVHNIGACLTTM